MVSDHLTPVESSEILLQLDQHKKDMTASYLQTHKDLDSIESALDYAKLELHYLRTVLNKNKEAEPEPPMDDNF